MYANAYDSLATKGPQLGLHKGASHTAYLNLVGGMGSEKQQQAGDGQAVSCLMAWGGKGADSWGRVVSKGAGHFIKGGQIETRHNGSTEKNCIALSRG